VKKRLILFTAAFFLFSAGAAWSIDVQNFKPAMGTQNLLTLYTSGNYTQGQFGFSLISSYASDPLIFKFPNNQKDLKVIEQMYTTELSGAVGIFDWWEIGVSGNYATVAGKDLDKQLNPDFPETTLVMDSGPGDMRAYMKFRVLENKPGSIGIAIVPLASFPTGKAETYTGAKAVDAGGRLVIDKRFDRVNIVVNGGYMRMGDHDGVDYRFDPTGRAEFGAGVTILAHKHIELLAEIFGRTVDYHIEELDPETPTEALGAAKFFAGPVHFTVGGGAGMNSGMGNPKWRGFAGVAVTWPPQNRGVPKPQQLVPAANVDPKTIDSDHDGLTDYDEKNITRTDPMNPDTDGDGLKDGDEVRKTKTNPLKADTDGDGLSDFEEVKVYYTNALKVDSDGDSLSDGAEVKQYRTNPNDPDTDHDGVPDNTDGAPLEPETVNGILDEDGIPEVILAKRPSGVTLTDSMIFLPQKLMFAGPNNDKLEKFSAAELKDIALLLAEYPNIKIEIQGHTAPTANKVADIDLSTRQSRAVYEALLKEKVAGSRMAFKGYGGSFPIASNATPEGQAKNSRIDFVITEK
jgi:outer membrane protein OmpA-like peptidoglycan-associated protein